LNQNKNSFFSRKSQVITVIAKEGDRKWDKPLAIMRGDANINAQAAAII
jgi:hypothetical protein